MGERGLGGVYQPTYRTRTRELKYQSIWWVQYSFRGRKYYESSHSPQRSVAVKLLRRRLEEIGRGRLIGPDVEKTTFEDLAEMHLNHYRVNRRRSLDRLEDAINHLRTVFSDARALEITTDRIMAYVVRRQEMGAANGTVNQELAALKRMFRLGEQAGKVSGRPYIELLRESNVRKGFFEPTQLRALLRYLPDDLRPIIQVAYLTGWRLESEILTRQLHHVDIDSGWLRLEPGETKNDEGRMFPLIPDLRAVLERQLQNTRGLERATGQIIPWLFHRQGRPIKNFRRAWLTACKRAGLPGRIPHDFRRTAVRNLERAGVPRSAAMKMVGHKTEAIYRRYAIVDEAMLKDAGAKLSLLHDGDTKNAESMLVRPQPWTS